MFCRSLLTITLVASSAAAAAVATATAGPSGCAQFDANWNLLAFGFNGKDYNAGTQDKWTSTTATDITTSNRPPFDLANATCYLSQFTNAIYFLNVDSANPTSIYIYDVTNKSWSMQSVTIASTSPTSPTFDSTNFAAILDHDTNVFYAYSNGSLFSLDMGLLKAANSTAIPWNFVQQPDLSNGASGTTTPGANTAGYQPTMALAQNHIFFMGVSGLPAGSVKIFVIHFSYLQPAPQSMGNFPTTHGKTASFFLTTDVQHAYAFIPDDASSTFVINVETNTTQGLAGPPIKDPFATYSASTNALVQLTTSGNVSFLPYDQNATTSGGSWSAISALPAVTFSTSKNPNTSSSSASGTASGATSSSTGSSTTSSNGSSSGIRAVGGGMHLVVCMALAALLGFVGLVL